jgi:glycosyltransferase involved in cell wall biosynthesis
VPKIRVFLLTYQRPALLPRALASLQAQTFTDWVCELHNDDPGDNFPRQLVEATDDRRITLHHHSSNWGAVATFNHAFRGGPEPFLSILEDDNWWEPTFFSQTLEVLEGSPSACMVWSNMHIWQEEADSSWSATGRCIWSQDSPTGLPTPRVFRWPQILQCFDALHSQGAMLVRTTASSDATVPAGTPLAIIEPVRERLLDGELILIPEPLGNFARTLRTARQSDQSEWASAQMLVAGSFLRAVSLNRSEMEKLWSHLRSQTPSSTPLLFYVAFSGTRPWSILSEAKVSDWLRFIAGAIRRPRSFYRIFLRRFQLRPVWTTIRDGAKKRSAASGTLPPLGNCISKRH